MSKWAEPRIGWIYNNMIRRCTNQNDKSYPEYGGRGITVCNLWLMNPEAFQEWALANGYESNLSIDRINNDLGYNPQNCRWATPKMQANNRRVCNRVVAFGKDLTLTEWSEFLGIDRRTIRERLKRGIAPEIALTTPAMKNGRIYKKLNTNLGEITPDAEMTFFSEWVKEEMKKRKMQQKDLYLAIHRTEYSLNVKLNRLKDWTFRDIVDICNYFDTTIGEVFGKEKR